MICPESVSPLLLQMFGAVNMLFRRDLFLAALQELDHPSPGWSRRLGIRVDREHRQGQPPAGTSPTESSTPSSIGLLPPIGPTDGSHGHIPLCNGASDTLIFLRAHRWSYPNDLG